LAVDREGKLLDEVGVAGEPPLGAGEFFTALEDIPDKERLITRSSNENVVTESNGGNPTVVAGEGGLANGRHDSKLKIMEVPEKQW
jgi:hypothetical protein